jgi:hypothetical protein
MGRSVGYLNNATGVAYVDVSEFDEDGFDWECFKDNIIYELTKKYPSLWECDKWEGRECHIFLENNQVNIAVSEYMGLASISVAPKDAYEYSYDKDLSGLNARNAHYIGKFIEDNFGEYRKIGSFSNGEGVFERVA